MSQECYDQLVAEIRELVNVELPKAKEELVEARARATQSENFEYHAAKRAHGRLPRVRYGSNSVCWNMPGCSTRLH